MKLIFALSLLISGHLIAATIIPFERDSSRIERPSYMASNNRQSAAYTVIELGDELDNLFHYGFSFDNMGPNDIVTTTPEGIEYASRDFTFITEDKAKRETYLWVTDNNGSGRISDLFESIIVFLPRENQMHIEELATELLVTLTTGEEVRFSKKSKMIIGGVMKEEPVDFNPDRAQRKFARLTYSGKGLMIRVDTRGNDPRINTTAQIIKGNLPVCKIPSKVFWTQDGFPLFRFVSDEEAYQKIKEHCGSQYIP